jgi:rod shape determining protein RodA
MNFKENFLTNLSKIPISIISLVAIISCYGFLILYSANNGSFYPLASSQMMKFFIFMAIAIFIGCSLRADILYKISYPFFILNIGLLLFVHKFGHVAKGGARWLNVGFFKLQPSEIAKISIILFLARYFHDLKNKQQITIVNVIPPFLLCILPIILIIKQPDLGTGLICLGITIGLIFISGLKVRYFIGLIIAALCAAPILWSKLHDYQKKRILIFLNPNEDLLGAGYNIHQSKIAIGSGGVFGKGFLAGSQSHLYFLPEFQTDFAFALLCEEFGFMGAITLIGLYFLLILRYVFVSFNCNSVFAKMLVSGVALMLFLHCFINIGMVMGIMPVVGVPLPFISYGGTMIGVMLIGMGFVLNAEVNSGQKKYRS